MFTFTRKTILSIVTVTGLAAIPVLAMADIVVYETTCQWSTVEVDENGVPSDVDLACLAGEIDIATGGGGGVVVIGTHGGPGTAQCLPEPGTIGGPDDIVCSICYAGTPGPNGEDPIVECVADDQGRDCEDVIGCTGPVAPIGWNGVCNEIRCTGVWVNACGDVVVPQTPGICYTYDHGGIGQNFPAPNATVGCFAGDDAEDIHGSCFDAYDTYTFANGQSCGQLWGNPNVGAKNAKLQQCNSLVNNCSTDTMAECQANGTGPFAAPGDVTTLGGGAQTGHAQGGPAAPSSPW